MKYLFTALTICFTLHVTLGIGACSDLNGTDSRLYEWTDESGTVNFSDDPMKIPGKYEKGVKRRDSIKGEASSSDTQQRNSEKRKPAITAQLLYGEHDENWWRNQYSSLRSQIATIKEALPEKEAQLKELHYKKVVSNSYGYGMTASGLPSPRKRKDAYLDLYQEIKDDKAKLVELEKKLAQLEENASRESVPFEWREPPQLGNPAD